MTTRVVRLPDVGEGVAEAELVAWHVAVGDEVTSETVLAEVLTDKATIEVSAPVGGTVTFLRGEVGEVLAVGSDFVGIDIGAGSDAGTSDVGTSAVGTSDVGTSAVGTEQSPAGSPRDDPTPDPARAGAASPAAAGTAGANRHEEDGREVPVRARAPFGQDGRRPVAAPAVRRRATELGVDLRRVAGSGPAGRVTHADLDDYLADAPGTSTTLRPSHMPTRSTVEVPIVGVRRKIAERMSNSVAHIPHITYVDEIDVGAVEDLRRSLNTDHPGAPRLTLLPFLVRGIVIAVGEQPHLNATFDDDAGVLTTHGPVHAGIATQTDNGLLVPVVRDADQLDIWATASEIARVTEAARTGKGTRAELSGSTITITSLGALGGLVTTPIINRPEVAIVGVNKMQVRPMWDGQAFVPRTMMNLSSSFDHRMVDGWDAATFVQRLKQLLETPALLFIAAPHASDGHS